MRDGIKLAVAALTLAGLASARAQPIIIPLQNQKPAAEPQQRPVVSAPPEAPPQAGPSLPSTTDTAGGPSVDPQEETASQPTRP